MAFANLPRLGCYCHRVDLNYDEETKQRLRDWRTGDPQLYARTAEVLDSVKADPEGYGAGEARGPRLKIYQVPGRDDEYVVTWEVVGGELFVGEISTVDELRRRAAFGAR